MGEVLHLLGWLLLLGLSLAALGAMVAGFVAGLYTTITGRYQGQRTDRGPFMFLTAVCGFVIWFVADMFLSRGLPPGP